MFHYYSNVVQQMLYSMYWFIACTCISFSILAGNKCSGALLYISPTITAFCILSYFTIVPVLFRKYHCWVACIIVLYVCISFSILAGKISLDISTDDCVLHFDLFHYYAYIPLCRYFCSLFCHALHFTLNATNFRQIYVYVKSHYTDFLLHVHNFSLSKLACCL
jgi:hypothetical protein